MKQEEIEKNIAFIIEQQANFFADIEERKAVNQRTDALQERIDKRLDRAVRLGTLAVRQEREKRREMEKQWTEKVNALINAQMQLEDMQLQARVDLAEFRAETKVRQAENEKRQAENEKRQAQAEAGSLARHAEAEKRQAVAEQRQAKADADTALLKQAMAELAQVVANTQQRVNVLENHASTKG